MTEGSVRVEEKVCCSLGGGLTGEIHQPSDITPEGYPRHTLPIGLRRCVDSRRAECPYALTIDVSTGHVTFQNTLCFYALRTGSGVG